MGTHLFKADSSFTQISLAQLARSFLGDGDETIGIAGFQRYAVWKESKIEDLWDSILCQFPIGSLMLARYDAFREGGYRRPQITRSHRVQDTLVDEKGVSYIVVDGQQRLNAIAMGFLPYEPGNPARLWIELEGPRDASRRQFDFYLCTQENPFGAGLSPDQKRRAFTTIGKDDHSDDWDLSETYPFLSKLPFPFYDFWRAVKSPDAWESLRASLETLGLKGIIRERLVERIMGGDAPVNFNDLVSAVLSVIHEEKYLVPAAQIKKSGPWMNAQKLGKLFERVNISGEVPPQSELFFSALKLRYPEINNYVAEIYNDSIFNRLLRPTDLIFIALRMVDPSISALRLDRFEKIVNEKGDELVQLLEKQANGHSIFSHCLEQAYIALHHTGEPGDIGLPRQYLARLRPRVWQTIAIWLFKTRALSDHQFVEHNRLDLLRFAVMDAHNYFLAWRRGFSAYINSPTFMPLLSNTLGDSRYFPASELVSAIWKKAVEDHFDPIRISHEDYRIKIQAGVLIKNDFELPNEDLFLLYAQRQKLHAWEDQRLDIDHIVPAEWMYFRGYHWKEVWHLDENMYYYRYRVLNSSGNKRYWPESLNRSDRHCSPGEKYIHEPPGEISSDLHNHFQLTTVEDVLSASAIGVDQAGSWTSLTRQHSKLWDEERFGLFKQLTDERRCMIYQQFYESLQIEPFFSSISSSEDKV